MRVCVYVWRHTVHDLSGCACNQQLGEAPPKLQHALTPLSAVSFEFPVVQHNQQEAAGAGKSLRVYVVSAGQLAYILAARTHADQRQAINIQSSGDWEQHTVVVAVIIAAIIIFVLYIIPAVTVACE